MSKADAAVYLRAAALVANANSCAIDCAYPCCAMSKALPKDADAVYCDIRQKFINLFIEGEWHGHDATKDDRLIASLALCFAAAMASDGDL